MSSVNRPVHTHSADYRPSWVDAAQTRLEHMAWPWYVPLVLLPALFLSIEVALLAVSGQLDVLLMGNALIIINALAPSYIFGLLYILDRRAQEAIKHIGPELRDMDQLPALETRISSMPFWPTMLATFAGFIFFATLAVGSPMVRELMLDNTTHLTRWVRLTEGTLTWMIGWTAIYHTVRQLRIIDHVFTRDVSASLLNQAPLYGLASLTAATAIGLAIPPAIMLVLLPQLPSDILSLSALVAFILTVGLAFVAPVYRLHEILEEQKKELLGQNGKRLEHHRQELHRALENDNDEGLTKAQRALDSLNLERNILRATRTWPWPPGAPGRVAAGLLLPILIWLIQLYLGTWIR